MILHSGFKIGQFLRKMFKIERNILQQSRLISFQPYHIVCRACTDSPDNFLLATHGVSRYNAVLYVQGIQKLWHSRNLVGLFVRHNLTQYQLILRRKCADHMICLMAGSFTAANGLPIYSDYAVFLAVVSQPVIQAF